jgi:hypothetical protein
MKSLLVGGLTGPALAPRECGIGLLCPDASGAFAASLEEAGAVPAWDWALSQEDSGAKELSISVPREAEEATPRPAKRSARSHTSPIAIAMDLPLPLPTPPWILSLTASRQGIPSPDGSESTAVGDSTNGGRRSQAQHAAIAVDWSETTREMIRPAHAVDLEPFEGDVALQVRIGAREGEQPAGQHTSQPGSSALDLPAYTPAADAEPIYQAEGRIERRDDAGIPAPQTPSDATIPVVAQPASVPSASKPVLGGREVVETREIAEPQFLDGPAEARGPREFTVRMEAGDDMQATVRIRESASGQIDVQVRTPNPQLSASLRSEADSLKAQLESSGVQAQIGESVSTSTGNSTGDPGQGTFGNGNGDGWGSGPADENQARESGAEQQQQRRSRWLEEMEKRNAD